VATFNVIGLTFSSETLLTRAHTTHSQHSIKKTMSCIDIDVRKEKCIGVGFGPILAPPPQMVAPDKTLPASAKIRIPIIISQFKGLVHPTVTVSQVGRLRRPQMGTETFSSTGSGISGMRDKRKRLNNANRSTTYNPIAFAKCRKPPSARTHGSLRPEMITLTIFGFFAQVSFPGSQASRERRLGAHVERFPKPTRIVIEKGTASRPRVNEIYALERRSLRRRLLEHEWFKCSLEAQERCERDVHHYGQGPGMRAMGGLGSRVTYW
jgi:hypothetical protein